MGIVTGATSGIGLETATALASWNATVVLPVRDVRKGELVKDTILASLPRESTGSIRLMDCDLASFASVRKFAKAYISHGLDLHMLVLNAGMMADPTNLKTTEDGVETTYQVNHLAHFLLTRLLLETLLRSAPSRVVHVSSLMHYLGTVDKSAYSKENRNADNLTADKLNSYSTTKLMNVMFSNKLHRVVGHSGVTSVSVHPGYVVSALDQHLPPPLDKLASWFRKKVARSAEDGAITQVTAATLPELNTAGGQYLEDRCISSLCTSCILCEPTGGVRPKSEATNVDMQDWLWDTSSAIVGMPP